MGLLLRIWNGLTYTRAIEKSSGKLEVMFFETLFRVTYLTGFSTSDRNIPYLIYSNTLKLLIILLIFSEFWCVLSTEWSMDAIIDSVNIIVIQLSAIYKYRNLLKYKNIFKNLASSMESPYFDLSTSERKKMVTVWQKRNEAYLWLLLGLGSGTLVAWHTYPLLDDLDYNLMVPIRLPFDYYTPLRYIPTYTVVLIVFSYVAYFVMVNDLTMQAHVLHLLCQFSVLDDCFRNILRDCCEQQEDLNHNMYFMTDDFKQKYVKKLDCLIKQHQLILNNVLTLKAILSGPMLGQLAVSTTLICSIGYQVATNTENYTKCLMGILYLGYNMSVLYIICRWCEEVKIQSENIGEAVYCSGWERGISSVQGVRARLLIVMARANKPLVLTAGGMYDLSLASYSKLIKTSYSALTVLLRLRHEHD
ncbi:odorant receptor 49a-like [Epargyreus clarus]|uniref:odorant receptor 49a-like n=1 Tax=Epargyreus clarus TaxID=520877 RepID=UPI003C2B7BB2